MGGKNSLIIMALSPIFNLGIKDMLLYNGVNSMLRPVLQHSFLWICLFAAVTLLKQYVPFLVGVKAQTSK